MGRRMASLGWLAIGCGPTVTDAETSAASAHASDTTHSPGDSGDVADGDSSGAVQSGGPQTDGGAPDPDGPLWVRTYDGETHNRDVGIAVAVGDGDAIFVGGLEVLDAFGGDSRSWLARLDGEGNVAWIAGESRLMLEAVAVTPGGRVVVAGRAPAPVGGSFMAIRSHGPDGEQEWAVDAGGESAYDVAAIGEDVVAVGATGGNAPPAWITRRDAAGSQVFTGAGDLAPVAVAADAESFVVAAAESSDAVDTTLWLLDALDGSALADPVQVSGVRPLAIARDANGPVLLGVAAGVGVGRLNGDGDFEWFDKLSDDNALQFEWDVALDPAGNVIVAGSLHSELGGAFLRKYSPSGDVLWTQTYRDGPALYVNGVAVTATSDIVVVGSIRSAATDDDIWVSRWPP